MAFNLEFTHPVTKTFDWYSLDIESVLKEWQSDRTFGLTQTQVAQRQDQFGPNDLRTAPGRSKAVILVDQFKNIMLLMLIAVAVVSLVLDLQSQQFPKDAVAIFAIVMLNGWLGFIQESRAEQALAALKSMTSSRVRVLRQGQEIEVDAAEVVPGDVIYLEAGVQVPADGRLLKACSLQIRESALTGEAEAVHKIAEIELPPDTALGDRLNFVFRGTEVIQGRGTVIVTATGMDTELGRIATMLESVETEPTPLQKRMEQLGNVLVSGSLGLVGLIVLGGIISAGNFSRVDELLEVSLSMAVAVVPEGLPAVITVTLALGTQRMVRRHALIRKLPAVETLGSVTTICSDKTGTLTQNKMVAQQIQTLHNTFSVNGEGYEPTGEFLENGQAILVAQRPELELLLITAALCNDAALQKEQGEWCIIGDPTEGALLVSASKAGFGFTELHNVFPRQAEIPFTSERKRMSVVCDTNSSTSTFHLFSSPHTLFCKGSPELILESCTQFQNGRSYNQLTFQMRERILAQNNSMASQGLRVIGVALKPLTDIPKEKALVDAEQELTWLGLIGILDAPRPEAKSAVKRCRLAGIRPVMITGDHQLTAMAIAQEIGIAEAQDQVLSGQELAKMTPKELEKQVDQVSVYARVAPEHKLQIVQALQRRHAIVAMTGDGVNDAPALKQADIGIAMGITGTDVSKEASDMVLLDDDFATIVAATEEGRVIYSNIRRFIKYILGSNLGEVITIAASPLLGLGGVPLTPLQILWMNLVTDGLPALALAVEPAESGVMHQPPHDPRESIFARGLGFYMIRIGLILSILSIGLMAWAHNYTMKPGYSGDPDTWKSMVFTTLCLAQMGHAMAVRSDTQLTIKLNFWSNPYLLGAVGLTTVLQLLLLYMPWLQSFFGVHPLSWMELLICLGFSALMFVWIELEKLLLILWNKKRS